MTGSTTSPSKGHSRGLPFMCGGRRRRRHDEYDNGVVITSDVHLDETKLSVTDTTHKSFSRSSSSVDDSITSRAASLLDQTTTCVDVQSEFSIECSIQQQQQHQQLQLSCENDDSGPTKTCGTPRPSNTEGNGRSSPSGSNAQRSQPNGGTEQPRVVSSTSSCGSDVSSSTASPCPQCKASMPFLPPSQWPQRPVFFRPSPNSGTRVLGVRFDDGAVADGSSSPDYLWTPSSSSTATSANDEASYTGCPSCCALPINDGFELEGKALVVDFESPLFRGSLLLRLRDVSNPNLPGVDDAVHRSSSTSWFHDKHFRYQVLVRGRFRSAPNRQALNWKDLITGYNLLNPPKKLPPKFLLWSGMKVLQFFAPQLDLQMESKKPMYCWLPLGSAPRSIWVHRENKKDAKSSDSSETDATSLSSSQSSTQLPLLARNREEPSHSDSSLLPDQSFLHIQDPLQRARARKRAFEKMYVSKSKSLPPIDSSTVYEMEFLQHLVNYQDLELELGSGFGTFGMEDVLNGQPMQFLAQHAVSKESIFSFEIWNDKVWKDASDRQN